MDIVKWLVICVASWSSHQEPLNSISRQHDLGHRWIVDVEFLRMSTSIDVTNGIDTPRIRPLDGQEIEKWATVPLYKEQAIAD